MATIGLDKLYYAPITEAPMTGEETYGTPVMLAKAISAELSVELAEATLWADDGPAEVVKEFKGGKLTLGVDDISLAVAEQLTGAVTDSKGVMVSAGEDIGQPVAIGFRARKSNGLFRYFWLYKVKFAVPSASLATKGDSITFQTPKIEGTVMRRNKPDANGKHPWKAEVTEGDAGVDAAVIPGWYGQVYEPSFPSAEEANEDEAEE
jgi:phi13 family phage major tail protein